MIIGIVCVDAHWGIGYENRLLFNIREDMNYFTSNTLGNTVVMGLTTFYSIGKPLKNRNNVVISFEKLDLGKDVTVLTSIDAALEYFQTLSTDIYIIGGASIYRAFLPYYDQLLITKVEATREADTFFPNIDEMDDFRLQNQTAPIVTSSGHSIKFCRYTKIHNLQS